jgi:type 1 fimbria pilin
MRIRIAGLAALLTAAGLAHDEHAGKPVSVTGTVVDTGCYMSHDSKGEKHTDCATMCAKNGVPLAIVDAAGKLYLPVAADHKNPNAQLMPFIEKKVKVTGTVADKGGIHGIAIKTVEAVQ